MRARSKPVFRLACLFVPLLCGTLGLPTPGFSLGLISATVVTKNDHSLVTLEFDGPFKSPSVFALAAPTRLVIDVPELNIRPPEPGSGLVSAIRFGQPKPKVGRIVLDLTAPAQLVESRTFDADEGETSYRLVLDLQPTTPELFTARVKAPAQPLPGSLASFAPPPPSLPAVVTPDSPSIKLPLPSDPSIPPKAPPPPPLEAPRPITVEESRPAIAEKIRGRLPIVVVDAGHGGHDPGAPSVLAGYREKQVTLAIAKAIKAALDASGRFKTVLTRDDDTFIPLAGRYEKARAEKADLFMSIHADSISDPSVRGATIYTLSQRASDKEAEKLAAKENKADIITGINLGGESADVTNILIDLAQRETLNYAGEFAQIAVRELSKSMIFRSNFHRFAGFVVLKAPDVPSVLIETGYMSNQQDSQFLFSAEGQQAIAQGVLRAVEHYFSRRIAP